MEGFWRGVRPFLTRAEKRRVAQAIARAERGTTGEIHVHVAGLASPDGVIRQAARLFFKLGLDKTERRNGALILVAVSDRRFAIWGDRGIHARAGSPLWETACRALERGLRDATPCAALESCVAEVGRALAQHFPADGRGADELPDAVSED